MELKSLPAQAFLGFQSGIEGQVLGDEAKFWGFFSQNSEMKHFSGIQTKTDTSSVSTQKAQPCWRRKMGSRKDFFQLKKSMVATTQTSSFTKTDEHRGEKNPPKRLKYEK